MSLQAVAVYCGFRQGARAAYGQAADALGRALAQRGITLVYGGGGQGMMRRVADAALEAGGAVVGVIPEDLVEREQAHSGLSVGGGASRLEVVADMHERKARMLALADATAVLPGGFGTLDELFEVLTWAQLGIHGKPCGMINVEGYFDHLLAFLDHAEGEGYVRSGDRQRLTVAPSPEALLAAWA